MAPLTFVRASRPYLWRLPILLIWMILIGWSGPTMSQNLTADQAAQIANSFIQSKAQAESPIPTFQSVHPYNPMDLTIEGKHPAQQSTTPQSKTIFVATFMPAGFVIIDAQRFHNPIIGWSINDRFPDDPAHPLHQLFLPQWHTRTNQSPPTPASTNDFIAPLIPARWGQDHPWNQFCPTDRDSSRAPAGCVAVAMAQVMNRWKWPETGVGSNRYIPPRHPLYGQVFADFAATTYEYDQMDPVLPNEASALLIFHAGVASFMNYGPDESSASVDRFALEALKNNFLYQQASIYFELEDFPQHEWIRMLQRELVNKRPLIYSGSNPNGRTIHAFNIDGFRDVEYFHFNWGWAGVGNGWYRLDGMAGGSSDYSKDQGAIFHCQPTFIPLHDRPANLNALSGNNFVKLIWDNPHLPNLSHFTIIRDDNTIAQTIYPNYTDETVQNGRIYQYQVIANYVGETPGNSPPTPHHQVIPWDSISLPYQIDFEEGLQGWSSLNRHTGYTIKQASELGFGRNTGMIAGISSTGYPEGTHLSDYLISPLISLPDSSFVAISFNYILTQSTGTSNLKLLWRDFDNAVWHELANLKPSDGWSAWQTNYYYLPEEMRGKPIQIAFYYNDFYDQGSGCAIDDIKLYEVPVKPIPGFKADQPDNCLGTPVTFIDTTKGLAHTWLWDFGEGASPRTKTGRGPHLVTYADPGPKDVSLLVNNLDYLFKPDYIMGRLQPSAGFTYERNILQITFTSHITNADIVWWDFGDGTTSTELNPIHDFRSKKLYHVHQIVYNGSCPPDTASEFIDLRLGTGIDNPDNRQNIKIFPNPTNHRLTIQWEVPPLTPVNLTLLSLEGQVLQSIQSPPKSEIEMDLLAIPAGFYILRLGNDRQFQTYRILKISQN